MKQITIYSVTNTVNNRVYVGSTTNFSARTAAHKHYIRSKKHHNSSIRADSHIYPVSKFKFAVLESNIPISKRGEREDYWMGKLDSLVSGYNLQAANNYTHNAQTRALISIARGTEVSSYCPNTKLLVKTYTSMTSAAKDVSGYHVHISNVISGKKSKYKDLMWKKGSARRYA